jgi:hypothetical protein
MCLCICTSNRIKSGTVLKFSIYVKIQITSSAQPQNKWLLTNKIISQNVQVFMYLSQHRALSNKFYIAPRLMTKNQAAKNRLEHKKRLITFVTQINLKL